MLTNRLFLSISLFALLLVVFGRDSQAQITRTGIVFAVIEDSKVNLYSVNSDGSDRKLLFSDDLVAQNRTADDSIHAFISPLGKEIAYSLPRYGSPSPLYIIDTDGKNRRKILDNVGYHFFWSPSGQKILYPSLAPNGPEEFTPEAFGSEWHLLDLETHKDQVIAVGEDHFTRMWLWTRDDRILFGGDGILGKWISWKNLRTGASKKVRLASPKERRIYNIEITVSPTNSRTIVAFYSGSSTDESCDIFQLLPNGKLGGRFVKSPGYRCTPAIKWNGEKEFYYTRGVGPNGRVRIGETNKFGYYVLPSIYKYNFKTRKDEVVLKTDGTNMYLLEDVIENEAMIVTAIDPSRESRYAIELRRLDGSQPVTLYTSSKKISYVGRIKSS